MDVRESFSRLKKKVKHRLTGSKHKSGKTGGDTCGERVDATGSLLRPEHRVVTGGGHSDVEVEVGSGPRREGNGGSEEKVERVSPSPSTPSPMRGEKPDSM